MTRLCIELEDFAWYVEKALDDLAAIVVELGDERVNDRPDIPGANSAYVVVTHCCGVMARWGGASIAGRTIQRDRAAEFVARGQVAELLERLAAARAQLRADLATMEPSDPPRTPPDPEDVDLPVGRTQAGVALHIYEELSQHLGQLEVTRDVLLAGPASPRTPG
jgi:hypothetical protein